MASPALEVGRVDLPPDAVGLAGALHAAGWAGVALLGDGDHRYVGAAPTEIWSGLHPPVAPLAAGPGADAPRWVGVLPYEARRQALERAGWRPDESRPAPRFTRVAWHRYPSMLRVEPTGVTLISEDPAHGRRLVAAASRGTPVRAPDRLVVDETDAPQDHVARVAAARELILDGDLYQVNLARRLRLTGVDDPLGLYRALTASAPSPLSAAIAFEAGWVVSTTPELLLRVERDADGRRLITEPIKGTRPRGDGPEADDAEAAALEADPKERAELAMIVDVERNDLGAVATTGSVKVVRPPSVQRHPTVIHRSARIEAWARPEVSDEAIVASMVPSGSVTGAPKVRAMEVIAELEASRRGLYTGGFGTLAHDGTLVLSMAIRTVTLGPEGEGSYFTGGGIVAASDPERELLETRWKAVQLTRAARGG